MLDMLSCSTTSSDTVKELKSPCLYRKEGMGVIGTKCSWKEAETGGTYEGFANTLWKIVKENHQETSKEDQRKVRAV